jgi:hypothetical protein
MTLVGVDLHTREQSVAALDTTTGELQELRLPHDGDATERFYAALQPPVTVAIESTGYALWFHALIQRLGHTLIVGDAAKIRATVVRKTKTDRRDARHILRLLSEDRFPTIWVPDPRVRDLRALVAHRMRLVRVRTMLRNGVHAIALNYRLTLGRSLFTRQGLAQLQQLPLPTHTAHRREESLELLAWLDARIAALEVTLAELAGRGSGSPPSDDPSGRGSPDGPHHAAGAGARRPLSDEQARGELHRPGSDPRVVGRETPAGWHYEAGQPNAAPRARSSRADGASGGPRSQAALRPYPAPSRDSAGQGRGRPCALGPVAHHAARSR